MKHIAKTLLFLLIVPNFVFAQEYNKCGSLDTNRIQEELLLRGDHWGYGYQDLLKDLIRWEASSYLTIDSIGASVQNRTLWELRISDNNSNEKKHIIYIHVRTHPNEVQSFWVADEIIKFLISDAVLAQILRTNCIFYIVPMYNPDGVELEYARENANKIDIESNWYADSIQPEVRTLRRRFVQLMGSDKPIELALNLHSAYKCKRYFVYHHENGTSKKYTKIEKLFINSVVRYFARGIQPWNFIITWKNGTPKKYPESWWWLNFKEKVLALTYEDGNCEEAGEYDKTAFAILSGIGEYFNILTPSSIVENKTTAKFEFLISPNPVKSGKEILIKIVLSQKQKVKFEIFDINGHKVSNLFNGIMKEGTTELKFNTSNILHGYYFYKFTSPTKQNIKRLIIL